MQTIIKFDCPECHYPVKAEIIETITEAKYKAPGIYKCKCPICSKEVNVPGKNPGSGHNRKTRVWNRSVDGNN